MELKPTDGQCFNCGSKKHSKPDCPYPKVKSDANKGHKTDAGKVIGGGRVADQSDETVKLGRLDGLMKTIVQNNRATPQGSTDHQDLPPRQGRRRVQPGGGR